MRSATLISGGMKSMIAQNISSLRRCAQLTQEELANRLGVSRQSVAKWESGESVPNLGNASALARVLGRGGLPPLLPAVRP